MLSVARRSTRLALRRQKLQRHESVLNRSNDSPSCRILLPCNISYAPSERGRENRDRHQKELYSSIAASIAAHPLLLLPSLSVSDCWRTDNTADLFRLHNVRPVIDSTGKRAISESLTDVHGLILPESAANSRNQANDFRVSSQFTSELHCHHSSAKAQLPESTWHIHRRPSTASFQYQQLSFFSVEAEKSSPRKLPSRTIGTTKIPTPRSAPPQDINALERLRQTSPKSVMHKALDTIVSVFQTVVMFLIRLPGNIFYYATHPDERKAKIDEIRTTAKEELNHYWVGTKLLWADMQTARNLLGKTLRGSSLTRRERKQLLRTVSDLFRLVPFSMFIIIPMMEFALPFALRIFPNLLPSTFQDSLKAEESMKRELQSRIAMAQFFQETLEELAKEQKRKASKRRKELEEAGEEDHQTIDDQEHSAMSMLEFLEKARNGEMMPSDVIIRYANYFQDDLTLDNMPRMQLINMCRYMNISPYGSDALLRFQLRHRIRVLKEDDQRILWEGIDSLTKMELREACQERGMRSTGLSKDAYKRALQQWLDLSVNKNVPISLLIMSRTFFLREEMFEKAADGDNKSIAGLADAISGLDKDVLNEAILEAATHQGKLSDPEIRKIKLEVLSQQNELIRQEEEAREAATKKKEDQMKSAEELEAMPGDTPLEKAEAVVKEDYAKAAKEDAKPSAADEQKKVDTEDGESGTSEEDRSLSTDEVDAIQQLISDDPVSRERAELERIKAAMKGESKPKEKAESIDAQSISDSPASPSSGVSGRSLPSSDEIEQIVASTIDRAEREAAAEAQHATHFTRKGSAETAERLTVSNDKQESYVDDEESDPVVARLKRRVESMVDRIEVQLTDAKVKIGDKFHMLDKDKDGVLSREEMADVLQQVLKRSISFEEAMEIAGKMDDNHDGYFTVQELMRWCDEHKLIKFVEQGRDADMDRFMESQSSEKDKEKVDKEAGKA